MKKGTKEYRIVCMGDSLTEGYEIAAGTRWSDLLGAAMGLDIVNSGISGDTTSGMLSRFYPMVIAHRPSHVIIMGGTNDLWFEIPEKMIVSNILAMTKLARHNDISSIIGLPTLFYPQLSTTFSDIFLKADLFYKRLISFRAILKEVAESKDLPVIDFAEGMNEGMFLPDGVHPNEAGHIAMMENVKTGLKKILNNHS